MRDTAKILKLSNLSSINDRALLMRAVYEKPIDTMEDVVKSGQNIQVHSFMIMKNKPYGLEQAQS